MSSASFLGTIRVVDSDIILKHNAIHFYIYSCAVFANRGMAGQMLSRYDLVPNTQSINENSA